MIRGSRIFKIRCDPTDLKIRGSDLKIRSRSRIRIGSSNYFESDPDHGSGSYFQNLSDPDPDPDLEYGSDPDPDTDLRLFPEVLKNTYTYAYAVFFHVKMISFRKNC